MPTLIAEPGAGQSMTQAARDALRRVDTVLAENSDPLKDTIANLQDFSEGLARNTGKLDGIVAGLEKMTGGGAPRAEDHLRSARAAKSRDRPARPSTAQLAIPEPTAVAMLETQRMLFSPAQDYPGFADFLWADSIPKLVQARLIDSFENYDIAHAPLRTADIGQADFQLLIDVRRFRIAIGVRAGGRDRIVGADRRQERQGHRLAAVRGEREHSTSRTRRRPSPRSTRRSAGSRKNMIAWTVQAN